MITWRLTRAECEFQRTDQIVEEIKQVRLMWMKKYSWEDVIAVKEALSSVGMRVIGRRDEVMQWIQWRDVIKSYAPACNGVSIKDKGSNG